MPLYKLLVTTEILVHVQAPDEPTARSILDGIDHRPPDSLAREGVTVQEITIVGRPPPRALSTHRPGPPPNRPLRPQQDRTGPKTAPGTNRVNGY